MMYFHSLTIDHAAILNEALLPGWSENVSHTPGGVVRSKVGVSSRVFIGHSDPEFCPIVHLNFPVVLTSHWDQIPQRSYTPVHTCS